jgi:hypothetical protein
MCWSRQESLFWFSYDLHTGSPNNGGLHSLAVNKTPTSYLHFALVLTCNGSNPILLPLLSRAEQPRSEDDIPLDQAVQGVSSSQHQRTGTN